MVHELRFRGGPPRRASNILISGRPFDHLEHATSLVASITMLDLAAIFGVPSGASTSGSSSGYGSSSSACSSDSSLTTEDDGCGVCACLEWTVAEDAYANCQSDISESSSDWSESSSEPSSPAASAKSGCNSVIQASQSTRRRSANKATRRNAPERKILGARRQRAKHIQSEFDIPEFFQQIDDVTGVKCFGPSEDPFSMWSENDDEIERGDQVIVAVEVNS